MIGTDVWVGTWLADAGSADITAGWGEQPTSIRIITTGSTDLRSISFSFCPE
jgi:hypothetical protein